MISQELIGHRRMDMLSSKEQRIRQLLDGVADQLLSYSLQFQPDENLLICFHPKGSALCEIVRQKAEALIEAAGGSGKVMLQVTDPNLDKLMLEGVSESIPGKPATTPVFDVSLQTPEREEEPSLQDWKTDYISYGPAQDRMAALQRATKVLMISNKLITDEYAIEKELETVLAETTRQWLDYRAAHNRYCIVSVPDARQAQESGMTESELWEYYLAACDRDWQAVETAQKILVEIIQNTKRMEITAPPPAGMGPEWQTHLTFGIAGTIPVNSVAARNMPGSEVFTAPNRGTLEGRYAIPYAFMFNGKIIPKAIFTIEQGTVVNVETPDGAEYAAHINQTMDIDAGAREIGEFAIGTNPKVTKPTTITLLVEKSLGIHLAFGSAYTMKNYLGTPVNINNGVTSKNHIDVARIMTPEWGGGTITCDGVEIFRDGTFTDPRLAILSL